MELRRQLVPQGIYYLVLSACEPCDPSLPARRRWRRLRSRADGLADPICEPCDGVTRFPCKIMPLIERGGSIHSSLGGICCPLCDVVLSIELLGFGANSYGSVSSRLRRIANLV